MIAIDYQMAAAAIGTMAILVGGVFLAFSELVMDALGKLDSPYGIQGMQRINHKVFRTIFLFTALGLVPLMALLAIHSYTGQEGIERQLIISGTLIYLIGMLGVTIGGNVPMNEKLAKMDPETYEAAAYWQIYLKVWTRWNHLRTLSSFIAGILFIAVTLNEI